MVQPKPYRSSALDAHQGTQGSSVDELERMGQLGVWPPDARLLNLSARQLEVYRQPFGERYGELKTYASGQAVSPLLLDAEVVGWA